MEENDEDKLSNQEKWIIAVIIGVIFLIVSNPLVFRFSDIILGFVSLHTVGPDGKPTAFGWILHAVAFIIIIRILMT